MDQVPPPIDGSAPEPAPAQSAPPARREPGFFDELLKARATLAFLIVVALLFLLQARETPNLRLPFSDQVYAKYGGYHDCFVIPQDVAPAPTSCDLCGWETRNDPNWTRPHGQWWRFLSTLFVPRWGIDAFVYLFLFYSLGPPLEKMLGTTRFCILYLGAGIGGIAVGALYAPTAPTPGTILVVYALLGGIPGVVLGRTGSIARTVANPEARGAAFWLAFWLGMGVIQSMGYLAAGWQLAAEVAAAVFAFVFGWALGNTSGGPGKALLKGALPGLVVLACVGLVLSGYRWFDGGLSPRSDLRPGGRDSGWQPAGPDTGPPGGGVTTPEPDRAAQARDEASPLRKEWEPYLDRFGVLPVVDEALLTPADDAKIQDCYQALTEATESHTTLILGELDDLRVRCLILMGRHDAPEEADKYLALKPSPMARALAAVAYHYRAGNSAGADSERAEDYLEGALAEPGLAAELPEAVYYHAVLLYMRGADAQARELFRRYLTLVGDPRDAPRYRQVVIQQAKVQLKDE